jgi:pSer/pThr/pTyr-binding forkhead associated (FHA) protein
VSIEWSLLVLRLLAVAVLYAFLAMTIYVIWRDLRVAARTQPLASDDDEATSPAGWVRVVSGDQALLQPDDLFALQEHTTLGRAPDNHIVVSDTYVSSYHARLDRRDGEWWLTDLGSRNGTRLNDVPITKSVPLADGDVIEVGQVELVLEIGD